MWLHLINIQKIQGNFIYNYKDTLYTATIIPQAGLALTGVWTSMTPNFGSLTSKFQTPDFIYFFYRLIWSPNLHIDRYFISNSFSKYILCWTKMQGKKMLNLWWQLAKKTWLTDKKCCKTPLTLLNDCTTVICNWLMFNGLWLNPSKIWDLVDWI